MDDAFSVKNLGHIKYYLGLEVCRSSTGLSLSQRKYIHDLLAEHNLLDSKPLTIPFDQHAKLNDKDCPLLFDPAVYRSIVGKLLYLTISRPDISFSVQLLNQFMQAPRETHLKAAVRVLRYLKGTSGQGLFFPRQNSLQLQAYCNSDWGSCPITKRFVTGYSILLGSSLIACHS